MFSFAKRQRWSARDLSRRMIVRVDLAPKRFRVTHGTRGGDAIRTSAFCRTTNLRAQYIFFSLFLLLTCREDRRDGVLQMYVPHAYGINPFGRPFRVYTEKIQSFYTGFLFYSSSHPTVLFLLRSNRVFRSFLVLFFHRGFFSTAFSPFQWARPSTLSPRTAPIRVDPV